MDLKQLLGTLAIVFCLFHLAVADDDCKNLGAKVNEIDQCCQLEKIIPMTQADNCSSAADDVTEPREKMMCTLQCKLQSLGVMNGMQVVPEKVLEYANRFDGDWKEKAVAIVNTCNERISVAEERMGAKSPNSSCPPIGGFLMMCLMKHTIAACPTDKWQNSDFCNKLKSGECFKRPVH